MSQQHSQVNLSTSSNMATVVFHRPGAAQLTSITGEITAVNLESIDFENTEGFLINSFTNKECYLIQPEELKHFPLDQLADQGIKPIVKLSQTTVQTSDKAAYCIQLEKFKAQMANQHIQKAVLSRIIPYTKPVDGQTAFLKMVNSNPKAFCYWLQSLPTGTWLGATPEKLFNETETGDIQIHSLAGTQPSDQIIWTEKEYEEQLIVTNYVTQRLESAGFKDYTVGETETMSAGAVTHLCTTITITAVDNSLNQLVRVLHPTPAVCGNPMEKALELILATETHDRKLYTGFIGTLGKKLGNHLFVNLRCMELTQTGANLYVGGGITSKSNVENEWIETELKAQTMLSAIA